MKNGMRVSRTKISGAVFAVLLCLMLLAEGFLLTRNLEYSRGVWTDEYRHVISACEMERYDDYVVNRYNGEPDYWNLKPPLSMWCILAGMRLAGYSQFGMWLYSTVSMLALTAVLALWLRRKAGNAAGLFSALFFLACGMVYGDHFARFADADTLFVLLFALSMLCMMNSEKDRRWLYGTALCFGLAFMAKSFHAALIPLTCLVWLAVTGEIRRLKWYDYLLLLFFGLLPVAPWAAARWRQDGFTFFVNMFQSDVAARSTTVIEGHNGGALYYLRFLLKDPAAAAAMLLCAADFLRRAFAREKLNKSETGLILWFCMPVVFFSLCASKLWWYCFPCLPALAAGAGIACKNLLRAARKADAVPKTLFRAAGVLYVCAMLLPAGMNIKAILPKETYQNYDRLIIENFSRKYDAGTRIYCASAFADRDEGEEVCDVWLDSLKEIALVYGDLECVDGGTDAFCGDCDHAYLLCDESVIDYSLLEEYPVVDQAGPVLLLDNLM